MTQVNCTTDPWSYYYGVVVVITVVTALATGWLMGYWHGSTTG